MRDAAKDDIWFHAQKTPGSHVLLVTGGTDLNDIDDETVVMAAELAAAHSRARQSGKTAVEMCIRDRNIIEANTLLSGIGFESAGLAGAHAIHNGLTVLEASHDYYHGEKVAFGTLVQLMLENAPMEEIEEVLQFCIDVGLPVSLAQLGLADATPDDILSLIHI